VLTRYNRKSVTVITDDGGRWNVSPRFLKAGEAGDARTKKGGAHSTAIIPFKPK
jgi:hypothetical protein